MREIKFRAWNEHTKRMHHFDINSMASSSPYFPGWWHCIDKDCELNIDRADISELMQYTGLKDSKGVEIYEEDILRVIRFNWKELGHPAHKTNLTNICYVFWDGKRLAFRADGKFKGGGGFGWGFPIADDRADKIEIEVIGNIYENPELLVV